MQKSLLISIVLLIACQPAFPQKKDDMARVYLNNSVKSYEVSGSSQFTSILIEAFESGGENENLTVSELFGFFQNKEMKADTVTYGKNTDGAEFVFFKADKRKNYALIVYVEEYDTWDNIRGIEPDAKKISELLSEKFGYETEILANPGRAEFLLSLRKYTTMNYKSGDSLFIYFAGRGFFDELYQWNYLVMKDTRKDDDVRQSYMPLSQFLMLADNIAVDNVMVFVDAGTK